MRRRRESERRETVNMVVAVGERSGSARSM